MFSVASLHTWLTPLYNNCYVIFTLHSLYSYLYVGLSEWLPKKIIFITKNCGNHLSFYVSWPAQECSNVYEERNRFFFHVFLLPRKNSSFLLLIECNLHILVIYISLLSSPLSFSPSFDNHLSLGINNMNSQPNRHPICNFLLLIFPMCGEKPAFVVIFHFINSIEANVVPWIHSVS